MNTPTNDLEHQESPTNTITLRYDAPANVWIGKHLETGILSQGTTPEEAAVATLSAVHLVMEFNQKHGNNMEIVPNDQ